MVAARSLFAVVIVLAGCSKGDEPPPPTSGSPTAKPETGPRKPRTGGGNAIDERAQALFSGMCATCHGADGRGDGPAAPNLSIKPRDYTDAKWQASVTDDDLRNTIILGGQKTGKSPIMPGNPDLKDKPEVVDGLVQIIRGFAKK